MSTLVDTSVLLDILLDDKRFAEPSELLLRKARNKGRLVICEVVLAEIRPALQSNAELAGFCEDIGLEFEACTMEAAILAGSMYARYLANKGTAKRVLPDFLIGAQAQACGYTLLARDRGYYREYFKSIELLDPSRVAD
ncbi:MAG: PIN domain-containing protein [Spirochaetota bacterium]